MAAFNDDVETLNALAEAIRSSALRITPVDLDTDAVYFPAERTPVEGAVVQLTSEEHLACLVADAVGGIPIHAGPGASPVQGAVIVDGGVYEDVLALANLARERGYPVRVATYSEERAIAIASRLGIKAIGVKGLPEVEAALLLSIVGAAEPRLFRALVGFSLLVPEFKTRLLPPVTDHRCGDTDALPHRQEAGASNQGPEEDRGKDATGTRREGHEGGHGRAVEPGSYGPRTQVARSLQGRTR
jgi:hypothetical protein